MDSQQISHFKTSRISKKNKDIGVYMKTLITKQLIISIIYVDKNIKETLETIIKSEIEGKCIAEGYIKPNSSKIITYSSGEIRGSYISFEVVFECLASCPVEGMNIDCIAKNITKAGIRAEIDENPSPVVIFIARDHHHMSKTFSTINEGDNITIRVIGQRFELNDNYISIIATLIDKTNEKKYEKKDDKKDEKKDEKKKKPKLIIND
jgi:DNA-directed RNA polymerase subunit E'/Rpb7